MANERTIEITPAPSSLIESLRGLGYSPETAIADLIDNSLAASARTVRLDLQWDRYSPSFAMLDDGSGMDDATLATSMRLGGTGPLAERRSSDLGRFGLGLKTASLSQCRCLTVISRHKGITSALRLDVDVIATRGWIAIVPDELPAHPFVDELLGLAQGTLVHWDNLDALSGLTGFDKENFFLRLQDIRAHIGMIFHRYLDGDASRVSITLNDRPIKAWNPFLPDHPSITQMPSERIQYGSSAFMVKPYVLPHRDRFANDAEHEAAGGPGGWAARQGFYIYRGKRLIVPGSWLGLGGARAWTRDESSRLARIQLDLPTGMDRDWRIDVRKSQARPPGTVRSRLTAIAARCRQQAREVFAWRGKGSVRRGQRSDVPPIWITKTADDGTRYRINRKHPALLIFQEQGDVNPRLLDAVLSIIERTVPVERIWLDVSDAEGTPPSEIDPEEVELLAEQLAELGKLLPTGMPATERADLILRNLPVQPDQLRTSLIRILEAA